MRQSWSYGLNISEPSLKALPVLDIDLPEISPTFDGIVQMEIHELKHVGQSNDGMNRSVLELEASMIHVDISLHSFNKVGPYGRKRMQRAELRKLGKYFPIPTTTPLPFPRTRRWIDS